MLIIDGGEFKRGDTLAFFATFVDDQTSQPITGLVPHLKCQGRYQNGTLGVDMLITEWDDGTGAKGVYLFYNNKTADLTPGILYFDIQYTIDPADPDSQIVSTDTYTFTVIKDETK
jgi:hypothetical protein